ncbi:MAG: Endoglucanase precursor [Pelotomaculum sp. PtaB.Bin013]|uniref:S-layer homology domain-containing protein n=1 Tax=Pelotomaculum isophthalicicum JI TaxID=947010 RepID=A0A9X4JVC1_9FIRM|nr:S-layer homology domain-containing protein [Pelotomaculum isophthalicicum]MDF9407122.1 S-layer homology domain-containing protein [Pelotomaculum isophthalicicum JI]OPX83311.1 MAG: Endoglucanase precursor [Pelotomaculum sp. PtaB.Bin013]
MITPLTSRSNKRKKNKTLILFGICLALLLTCGQVAMAAAAPAGTTPEKEQQAEKTAFTDVASDNPLWPYVHYLVAKGILKGYPDGTFQPAGDVTRAQLAKVLVLAKSIPLAEQTTPTFSDVTAEHWAFREIEAAAKSGLFQGYPAPSAPTPPLPGPRQFQCS